MALNISNSETDRLVRELVEATAESITEAVTTAVRERLDRVHRSGRGGDLVADLEAIAERGAALPVIERRCADEILGYDDDGLPT